MSDRVLRAGDRARTNPPPPFHRPDTFIPQADDDLTLSGSKNSHNRNPSKTPVSWAGPPPVWDQRGSIQNQSIMPSGLDAASTLAGTSGFGSSDRFGWSSSVRLRSEYTQAMPPTGAPIRHPGCVPERVSVEGAGYGRASRRYAKPTRWGCLILGDWSWFEVLRGPHAGCGTPYPVENRVLLPIVEAHGVI